MRCISALFSVCFSWKEALSERVLILHVYACLIIDLFSIDLMADRGMKSLCASSTEIRLRRRRTEPEQLYSNLIFIMVF